MRRAVLEGKVGNKAIIDVPLLFADDLAKFERQCCGNGYRARDGLVVVDHLGSARIGENPADDIRGVIRPNAADDRVEIGRLPSERGLCEIREIQPYRDRSAASSTAIRSPVSTEERMCREVVLFSMAAIPIHQRRLRDAFIGGGACKALPACCRTAPSCRPGGHGASTPAPYEARSLRRCASRNDCDKR